MRNRDIGRKLLRQLNQLPEVKAIKLPAGPFMEEGTPDVLVVARGRPLLVEIKDGRDKLSLIQQVRARQWSEAGAYVVTATSPEDVIALVRGWL